MMTLQKKLAPIIDRIGIKNVWRPVFDNNDQMIVDGVGRWNMLLEEALTEIDFSGKTVFDLGCNLGYYSFYAARRGAKKVVGIDFDTAVIEGCHILKKHYGVDNTTFIRADFLEEDLGKPGDIVLLLDFIGKNVILKQKLNASLRAIQWLSRGEILMSLHPEYHIPRVLRCEPDEIKKIYGNRYITGDRFYLIDYVLSRMKSPWHLKKPFIKEHRDHNLKHPLLFSC
jgi:ribosomal protein L11 methyltransferase